ncbi:hypothetical protein XCM_14795 [Xanthomonas citri pv. mangiferaeindicae]|nr:hypothetical protein XCM_14795 [Xanthomonas citri pv. mangiferaeindicae]
MRYWRATLECHLCKALAIPDSRFPIPDSRFPIPDSRFPIPDSPTQTGPGQALAILQNRRAVCSVS